MKDPFRLKKSEQLLERLYSMGILSSTKNLSLCQRVTASSFCRYIAASGLAASALSTHCNHLTLVHHVVRRRIPVVMVRQD